MSKQILALSSSREGSHGYLEKALPVIQSFLNSQPKKIAFIPFASVDNYADYHAKVSKALEPAGLVIETLNTGNARDLLEQSDCIMTGGGNTFKLLHDLYQCDVIALIRQKIFNGTPYIGWSAGANILGETICTTNDMPIIEPPRFDSLAAFPFQINPHYYLENIEGFNGETRDDRLTEFLKVNPQKRVYALPEGCYLQLKSDTLIYNGITEGYVFEIKGDEPQKNSLAIGTKISPF